MISRFFTRPRAEARLLQQPSTTAPSAHPRGAFLSYGNEVSYTIKKGRICFPIHPFQIEFYFPPIPLTLRTGCYTALHKSRSVQAESRGCPAR